MNQTAKEINKVTSTIILVSWKLIVYAVVIMLLYKGVTKGYEFGYSVFYSTEVAQEPGVNMRVTIGDDEKLGDIAVALERGGLVKNRYAFLIQSIFYEYGGTENPVKAGTYLLNTSMTSKEIIIMLRDGITEEDLDGEESQ